MTTMRFAVDNYCHLIVSIKTRDVGNDDDDGLDEGSYAADKAKYVVVAKTLQLHRKYKTNKLII